MEQTEDNLTEKKTLDQLLVEVEQQEQQTLAVLHQLQGAKAILKLLKSQE